MSKLSSKCQPGIPKWSASCSLESHNTPNCMNGSQHKTNISPNSVDLQRTQLAVHAFWKISIHLWQDSWVLWWSHLNSQISTIKYAQLVGWLTCNRNGTFLLHLMAKALWMDLEWGLWTKRPGKGGREVVHQARNILSGEDFAVKVLFNNDWMKFYKMPKQ